MLFPKLERAKFRYLFQFPYLDFQRFQFGRKGNSTRFHQFLEKILFSEKDSQIWKKFQSVFFTFWVRSCEISAVALSSWWRKDDIIASCSALNDDVIETISFPFDESSVWSFEIVSSKFRFWEKKSEKVFLFEFFFFCTSLSSRICNEFRSAEYFSSKPKKNRKKRLLTNENHMMTSSFVITMTYCLYLIWEFREKFRRRKSEPETKQRSK